MASTESNFDLSGEPSYIYCVLNVQNMFVKSLAVINRLKKKSENGCKLSLHQESPRFLSFKTKVIAVHFSVGSVTPCMIFNEHEKNIWLS